MKIILPIPQFFINEYLHERYRQKNIINIQLLLKIQLRLFYQLHFLPL